MKAIPRRRVGVLVALAVVSVVALPKLLELRRSSAPAAAAPSRKTLRVGTHRVAPAALTERLATTGTVRANEEVEIVSEISGKISAIQFEEGSRVSRAKAMT
jgi:membrane fusion protein (multidrug efflux system)